MEADIKVGDLVKLVPPEMYVTKEWEKTQTCRNACIHDIAKTFSKCAAFTKMMNYMYRSITPGHLLKLFGSLEG